MVDHQGIKNVFINKFGDGGRIVTGMAPGRVNLMGEHTDYNEGFVFPMAIDFALQMVARLRTDQIVQVYSVDYEQVVSFTVANPIEHDTQFLWSNYIRGVLWALGEIGIDLPGMEIAFGGNIPQGAGLSSSAALEVVTAIVTQALTGFKLEPSQLAVLCQRAENEFVGMKCGIMDQFISLMGQKGHALLLDCRSLQFQQVPMELGEYRILICHSGVKHSLVASEYNLRRQECDSGVRILQKRYEGIKALRDADLKALETCKKEMPPEVYRRCYHIISENERVIAGAKALQQGDLDRFGQLMNSSHESQRDFFEVSCPEVDLLVNIARKIPGVLGARITGGGFGGCTVNLVASQAIEEFTKNVLTKYQAQTRIEPRLYLSTPAAGARIIS